MDDIDAVDLGEQKITVEQGGGFYTVEHGVAFCTDLVQSVILYWFCVSFVGARVLACLPDPCFLVSACTLLALVPFILS